MANRNPYAAPRTDVSQTDDGSEEYGEIKVFSANGRLGRVRYIGYSVGLSIVFAIVIAMAVGLATLVSPDVAVVVAVIGYVAMMTVQFLVTIQRAHDMNVTGWLSLISLIPLGVLVFWLVPGTRGANNYGLQPPPNTTGVIVLACFLPLFAVVGILAAIAIPAYQDYTIRAQVSEGLNLAAGAKAAVEDAFSRTGSAPGDRLAAGLSAAATDTAGTYVESVDVVGGTILVTYGAAANTTLAGHMLALQPYVLPNEAVVWRCGQGSPPADAVAMDGSGIDSPLATDIEPRYLPSACRP